MFYLCRCLCGHLQLTPMSRHLKNEVSLSLAAAGIHQLQAEASDNRKGQDESVLGEAPHGPGRTRTIVLHKNNFEDLFSSHVAEL